MPETISLPLLDRLEVASPCHARWEDMTGDERTRHCAECKLNVHNISAMTRDDAEAFLHAAAGDRVCVRFYRRADGTILTSDCPVGLAKVRARARWALVRIATIIGLIGASGAAAAGAGRTAYGDRMRLRALKPFSIVCEWIAPAAAPAPPVRSVLTMGKMCAPVQQSTPVQAGGTQ